MKIKYTLWAVLLLLGQFITEAQDGNPDNSFGNNGLVITDIEQGDDLLRDVAQQNNGNLVVVGSSFENGNQFPTIVRYQSNGSVDTSFGIDGVVWNDYGNPFEFYRNVNIQEDGSIIAGGDIGPTGNKLYTLTRFLEDGTVDSSFGTNGDLVPFTANAFVSKTTILEDGSILISGTIFENGLSGIALKRYTTDGQIDTSFGANGMVSAFIGNQFNRPGNFELMSDGTIVLGGKIQDNSQVQNILLRYSSEGDLDATFGDNGVVSILIDEEYTCGFKLYNDGRIVLSCTYFNVDEEYVLSRLLRYSSDGDFDPSFGNGGYINSQGLSSLFLQENGRLLVVGLAIDFFEGGGYLRMQRYFPGGGVDTSLQYTQIYEELDAANTLIQDDGKILVAGSSMWYNGMTDFVLQRFNNNPLSIPEFESGSLVSFPNPTQNTMTVTYDLIENGIAPYQINDVAGKVLMEGSLSGDEVEIDLSALQSGMYFLNTPGSVLRLIKE